MGIVTWDLRDLNRLPRNYVGFQSRPGSLSWAWPVWVSDDRSGLVERRSTISVFSRTSATSLRE